MVQTARLQCRSGDRQGPVGGAAEGHRVVPMQLVEVDKAWSQRMLDPTVPPKYKSRLVVRGDLAIAAERGLARLKTRGPYVGPCTNLRIARRRSAVLEASTDVLEGESFAREPHAEGTVQLYT